jgi:hypothetical protein
VTAGWGTCVATLVVSGVVLLTGCTGDDDQDPTPAGAPTCPEPGQLPVVLQVPMEPLRTGGPSLDRNLRVTRAASGRRCLDVAVDHADPGPDVVSWEVVAGQAGEAWRLAGTGPEDEPQALRIDAPGCLEVSGSVDRA